MAGLDSKFWCHFQLFAEVASLYHMGLGLFTVWQMVTVRTIHNKTMIPNNNEICHACSFFLLFIPQLFFILRDHIS